MAALVAGLGCSSKQDASPSDDGNASVRYEDVDGGATTAKQDPIFAKCSTDGDCAGGKCANVGLGKACVRTRSCTGESGADSACGGVAGNEQTPGATDCCETRAVPGGSFNNFNSADYPTRVSPFLLDTFEVTTGRFRAWVAATGGNLRANAPDPGAGAHPKIPGSGWRSEWNEFLPASTDEVDAMLGPAKCQVGSNPDDYGAMTWWTSSLDAKIKSGNRSAPDVLAENTKEALDRKPLNCVPWAVLFAFCIWDGGRLPTNAEWGFAASGGSEQRDFPWGNVAQDQLVHLANRSDMSLVPKFDAAASIVAAALYDPAMGANVFPDNYALSYGHKTRTPRDNAAHIPPVGRKALGIAKWGQFDLGGGVLEWMLDEGPARPGTCEDCANVNFPAPSETDPNAAMTIKDFLPQWYVGGARVIRSGAWDNSILLANKQSAVEIEGYTSYPLRRTYGSLGGRCARDL